MNLRCSQVEKAKKMEEYLENFIEEQFDQQYCCLDIQQRKDFMVALKQVLFSHRHKKNDLFIQGIEFSSVRGVMYSYSYHARSEFFA